MKLFDLNERIKLFSVVRAKDDAGQPIETLTQRADLWAAVEFSGGESELTTGIASTNKIKCTVHRRTDVTKQWQVEFEGAKYNIKWVKKLGFLYTLFEAEEIT